MKIYKFLLLSFCLFFTSINAMQTFYNPTISKIPDHINLGQIGFKKRGYLVPNVKNPKDFIIYYSAKCQDPTISGIFCSLHFYPNDFGTFQCLENAIFTISDNSFTGEHKSTKTNTIALHFNNISEISPEKIIEILEIAFQQHKISISHQIPSSLENLVFEGSRFEFKKIVTLKTDPVDCVIYYELINPECIFDKLINVVYSLHFYKDTSTNSRMCLANSICILKQDSSSIFAKGNPFLPQQNKVFITAESFDCMSELGQDLVLKLLMDLHQFTINEIALSISRV